MVISGLQFIYDKILICRLQGNDSISEGGESTKGRTGVLHPAKFASRGCLHKVQHQGRARGGYYMFYIPPNSPAEAAYVKCNIRVEPEVGTISTKGRTGVLHPAKFASRGCLHKVQHQGRARGGYYIYLQKAVQEFYIPPNSPAEAAYIKCNIRVEPEVGTIYCGIIIFRGGSIFVVFVDTINHEFTSPTNNDV